MIPRWLVYTPGWVAPTVVAVAVLLVLLGLVVAGFVQVVRAIVCCDEGDR